MRNNRKATLIFFAPLQTIARCQNVLCETVTGDRKGSTSFKKFRHRNLDLRPFKDERITIPCYLAN